MRRSNYLRLVYRSELRPLLEMLKFRRLTLHGDAWMQLVEKTKQSIINSPRQYLQSPSKRDILEYTVDDVFNEFLGEMKQSQRRY